MDSTGKPLLSNRCDSWEDKEQKCFTDRSLSQNSFPSNPSQHVSSSFWHAVKKDLEDCPLLQIRVSRVINGHLPRTMGWDTYPQDERERLIDSF